ncbi:MAG: FtsX-like permease family protein, partial [Prevotella sp.]|nr:FtsX-like permease family protein [Prevotella sp.]
AAHSISPTDEKAVGSFNIEKQFQIFNNLFIGIDFLIWFVGLGALLSGIIGISNIMLVTVRERTREIGVRRALGAKPMTIVKQILSESFVLTAVAGFFGFFAGIAIIEMVNYFMTGNIGEDVFLIPPLVPFQTAISALIVLIISGILSGLMPAMRALRIKAIDAIREE